MSLKVVVNDFKMLGLQPAPPVGFNLTFMCPEGEVGGSRLVLLLLVIARCLTMTGLPLPLRC